MMLSESLHGAVEVAAETAPDNVAWRHGTEELSYAQLIARARGLAERQRQAGVSDGDIVGLYLERGPDMPVAMLAVLMAGAAFLPLGLAEPEPRRRKILADADPSAVIVHAATRDRFAAQRPVIDLSALEPGVPRTDERPAVGAAAAAYVIYTSGSTGVPRGVVVEHGNLAGHVRWLAEQLPLGTGDRVLQVAPYTFDAALTDFFWPLSCGATVVSIPEGDHLDPLVIATAIVEQGITALRLPPAMVPLLLAQPVLLRKARRLRYLICGGDRLPSALARRVIQTLPDVRLFNRYGPTEAAVAVTYHEVTGDDLEEADVPIGSPVNGAVLHIVHADGNIGDLVAGRSGELLIGGRTVARGYLGDEALTGRRFVEMPGVGRVFRTGDRVTVTAAGRVLFVDRMDEQVQVAGNRVELGEVRAELCRHPSIADCAIALHGSTEGTLAAYVVADPAPVPVGELRTFLLQRLPSHMVPSVITFLDRLPLTERGKVDLAALAGMSSR
ncbi:amino acid adenylation domain-containing protein [Streptomyces violaceusniger]